MIMSFTAGGAGSACFICKCSEVDELRYGKVLAKFRIRIHTFCLLLTNKLKQKGDPNKEGMYGYLYEDIKTEEKRIKPQRCYLCKLPYANIMCCAKKCFRTYHTVCGTRAGCSNEFAGKFRSWCPDHIKVYDSPSHDEDEQCKICSEELGTFNRMESVLAPCCNNGWFHRKCVALFAFTAGNLFKCPLCNSSTEEFKKAIRRRGVFIPQSDAAWEQVPNAYGELLERPSVCDAEVYSCPQGRNFSSSVWSRRMCEACGSTCRHDLCLLGKSYLCNVCRPIMENHSAGAILAGQTKGLVQNVRTSSQAYQSNINKQIQQFSERPSPTTPDNNGQLASEPVAAVTANTKKSKSRHQKSSDDNSTGDDVVINLFAPGTSGVATNSRAKKNKKRKSVPDPSHTTSDANRQQASKPNGAVTSILVNRQKIDNREDDASEHALPTTEDDVEVISPESGGGVTNGRAKKKKPKRRKSMLLMVPQDKETRPSDGESDPVEMPTKRCKLLVVDEPQKDHVELFVASVAASLRLLSLEEFCAAKKEINDLLYKFELKALA